MANTYKLIEAQTLVTNTATVNFTSIPQTYTDLVVRVSAKSNSSTWGDVVIRFNGGGGTYYNVRIYGNGAGTGSDTSEWTNYSAVGNGTYQFSNIEYYIPDYASNRNKSWLVHNANAQNHANQGFQTVAGGNWNGAAITSVQITDYNTTMQAGSTFYLYGII
jgi:hypothetical protein